MSWNKDDSEFTIFSHHLHKITFALNWSFLELAMPWNIFKRPLRKKPILESIDEDIELICTIFCQFDENWWIMANSLTDAWEGGNITKSDSNEQWNDGAFNGGADGFNDNSAGGGFEDNQGAGTSGGASGGCFNCGEGIYRLRSLTMSVTDNHDRRSHEG